MVDTRQPWREAWRRPGFRGRALATLVALVLALAAQARFYGWNEGRAGVTLPDPILALFAPRDVSWLTFGLIYAVLFGGVWVLRRHPGRILQAVQTYAVLAAFRMGMMALTPLDPPPRIIPLRDPLVELAGSGVTLTRDLFFSGHVATLTVVFLALPRGRLRACLPVAVLGVGLLTVWQHTHYAVDVLVAPFVAYGSFRLVGAWLGDGAGPAEPTPEAGSAR